MMDIDLAFERLCGFEGGYTYSPKDPGGETMWGITARVARASGYSGPMRDLPKPLAKEIARVEYWLAVRADSLPAPIRYAVFDAAYNSGAQQARKWLQRCLGVAEDGVLGPKTYAALASADPNALRAAYCGCRLQFMTDLPTWPEFGRGWARRVATILKG